IPDWFTVWWYRKTTLDITAVGTETADAGSLLAPRGEPGAVEVTSHPLSLWTTWLPQPAGAEPSLRHGCSSSARMEGASEIRARSAPRPGGRRRGTLTETPSGHTHKSARTRTHL